jgi:hypothetical protein
VEPADVSNYAFSRPKMQFKNKCWLVNETVHDGTFAGKESITVFFFIKEPTCSPKLTQIYV